jgi:hypothetical protein
MSVYPIIFLHNLSWHELCHVMTIFSKWLLYILLLPRPTISCIDLSNLMLYAESCPLLGDSRTKRRRTGFTSNAKTIDGHAIITLSLWSLRAKAISSNTLFKMNLKSSLQLHSSQIFIPLLLATRAASVLESPDKQSDQAVDGAELSKSLCTNSIHSFWRTFSFWN